MPPECGAGSSHIKGERIVSGPRQVMITCALCGSTLAPRPPHRVRPASNDNCSQKNCGSDGRKSWDMRIGGRFARLY